MKIGRREVGEIVRGCVHRKKSFLGSPRDVFRRPSAAPELIAPKFLQTTFPSKYFVLAEFHPPRLSFGGVMPPTPSVASLHYGLPYSIWQAIMMVWSPVVSAMPNMRQMLLQFINVVHPRLTDSLLDDAPHLVGLVDRIEVRTVHWPQIQKFQLLTFTR